ncbi:MAG: PTS system mannose/fructose/sorbose family transporter subunit IID [Erysipelotrichaceae bacterium]|nr:PTS system mannose/fructose/sorbose family transporter subunit IID [Erysipelotrichaceae bacterium]MBQ2684826.1 PTS system mannose/fructose/sorbose family transporter subunit IID [Erysipelotrichaceae bacterium]MBR2599880.1 PTS system mannose/fructose/sorbose family transporter subunit IID [Erysipelotrichaceae bacterium]MBR2792214.1 PTS system mannose/fructose/sorbose family transporter subunit IID [Erysipelotrichaceae bacterium]MBR3352134.1 PTS system mannose/fructose/sorbose family transport
MSEKKISPKTLKKSFLNWFFWNGCSQQAESMLGMAFGQAMAPVIEELYDTKEDRAAALNRHITLFNTESQVGSICNGITCALEESLANGQCTPEVIESVKVALIGPTSAIGDSLWVATIIPILLTICLSISEASPSTSWVGSVLYLIIYPVGTCILSWNLFRLGYKSGLEGLQNLMASGKLDKLTETLTLVGLIVTGALTASFVSASLPIQITKEVADYTGAEVVYNTVVLFNADNMLNSIFPKILPLGLTLLVYYLYSKKKWSPMKLMGLIAVLAAVLTAVGKAFGVY